MTGATRRKIAVAMCVFLTGAASSVAAERPLFALNRPPTEPLAPPPGTLGRTYRQLSQPIPETEHPRTGMLEICNVPPGLTVRIAGMDGYRGKDGIWYFKTERPLIPCVPFIYTVRFEPDEPGHGEPGAPCRAVLPECGPKTCCDYRVVRLIPGRTVYLQY